MVGNATNTIGLGVQIAHGAGEVGVKGGTDIRKIQGSRFLVLNTRCKRILDRDWAMVVFHYVTPFQG